MKEKKHLLFVCTANQNRSPTAESLFRNSKKYKAKSVGIHPLSENPITKEAILWADIIFCMEEIHKANIIKNFPNESKNKKIIIFGIPDIYIRDEPELVRILREKLRNIL